MVYTKRTTEKKEFLLGNREEGALRVKMINIQGLTKEKSVELEELLKEKDNELCILCLVETQQKYKKVDFSNSIKCVEKMREMEDKKGGGLSVLINKKNYRDIKEQDCKNTDILKVNIEIKNVNIRLLLTYLDVKDKQRNKKIMNQLDQELSSVHDEEKVILLGDFNGHLGYIGPQALNFNGENLLNIMEKWNLILLNGDNECVGEITRRQGDIGSTIDFILVNQAMYKYFEKMTVDENKDQFDLSDHCLLEATFKMDIIQKGGNKQRLLEREFYKTECDILKAQFLEKTNEDITTIKRRGDRLEMEDLEEILKQNADTILRKSYKTRVRISDNNKKEEPVWMNGDIRRVIKRRREYNRKKRRANTEEEKAYYEVLYKNEKEKAQQMKREARQAHEIKVTQEIKEVKGSGNKMWKMINKLKGIKQKEEKEPEIYDDEGKKLEQCALSEKVIEFWQTIYNRQPNEIIQEWNAEVKEEYSNEIRSQNRNTVIIYTKRNEITGNIEKQTQNLTWEIKEHMDSLAGEVISQPGKAMIWEEWRQEEVKTALTKIKKGKQPGPDKIKGDIIKWLAEDSVCIETLTHCLNKVIKDNKIPESWRSSKTVMIPKNNKPKVREHRPIALTNSGYKILMSLIKEKILEHIVEREELSVVQAGFTPGRRLEDNLFVLNYCIEDSKKRKQELVVAPIDYEKAFDSVDRRALIRALKYYECHPLIIDLVATMYTNDKTEIYVGQSKAGEIMVTNGIRQGCTGSPLLFILIVNQIIKRIFYSKLGFKNEKFYIPILYYADDGLMLSNSRNEMEEMINLLKNISSDYGLRINMEKSQCMIINRKEPGPEKLGEVVVVPSIKYLGITITDRRKHMKEYKEQKIKLARKMSGVTFSVIARSCNKLLIGKTYWKSVVLPSILTAGAVVDWNTGELERLQVIENTVWRQILGAPSYVAVEALRGEIGCATVIERDMKIKLCYLRYILERKNDLLTEILIEMKEFKRAGQWLKDVRKYMNDINIRSMESLLQINEKNIKAKVREWGEERWRAEMEKKSTLSIYRRNKQSVGEVTIYDNTYKSQLMFRGRTNSLRLNWRNRFTGGEEVCELCKQEIETLKHFLLNCEDLEQTRRKYEINQDTCIEEILLFSQTEGNRMNTREKYLRYIEEIWNIRKKKIRPDQ